MTCGFYPFGTHKIQQSCVAGYCNMAKGFSWDCDVTLAQWTLPPLMACSGLLLFAGISQLRRLFSAPPAHTALLACTIDYLFCKKKKKKKKKESIKAISKASSKLNLPTAHHERAHQSTAAHGGTHTISTSGCRQIRFIGMLLIRLIGDV